ncbi:cytidyltransferase-related domain protein [Thiorhodococcus drewsii AZ1]|uniref:Cytidyltransferase-related domain protein n=1 Tax=Thiorhodococcus drewsii AZ1 TaxID=765913 RepID=G2DXH1_9GAMM|nr:adenylyltransferase/cytidyltransferase family protein [Thiorhodococcus drewsii]EGV33020.1 cytidyltransferase-related domain protein [Thiorhodococcus drewsii AZ1]
MVKLYLICSSVHLFICSSVHLFICSVLPGASTYSLVGGTIGVYDLLHVGHLRFLQTARSRCDRLKVGIATAATAWHSKAATPVIPGGERLELIRGLACVDEADLFDGALADTTPAADWIAAWGVQVMFVSEEWAGSPRWRDLEPALAARGIRCVWLPYTRGVSSTIIKERIHETPVAGGNLPR